MASPQSPCLDNVHLQWSSGHHGFNKWRLASPSVVSNLFDLSDTMHVAATGLIRPQGTKRGAGEDASVLGTDFGSQHSRA